MQAGAMTANSNVAPSETALAHAERRDRFSIVDGLVTMANDDTRLRLHGQLPKHDLK